MKILLPQETEDQKRLREVEHKLEQKDKETRLANLNSFVYRVANENDMNNNISILFIFLNNI